MNEKLQRFRSGAEAAIHSSRGRNVLLYLLFVCVAFVFWVLLSLDSEVQRDFEVPMRIEDVPDSVTLIENPPSKISVVVHGRGTQFVKFLWGNMPILRVKFSDNTADDNIFYLSRLKLDGRLRDYFGQGVQVISARPDSIYLSYTTNPGIKVPIKINADIKPNLQYIISGPISANVDSVSLFSTHDIPRSITYVSTEPLVKSDLRDTSHYEVKILPIPGIRVIPDRIKVTVPVEPLIAKKRMVPVTTTDMPEELGIITFPSQVEVTYLVPMSAYNDEYPITAYVDFKDISLSSSKLKVNLSLIPSIYSNITLSPDSVEYIIEQKFPQQ